MEMIDEELREYVERVVLPKYDGFDKAHSREHARMVMEQSLKLADLFPELDRNMIYAVAAFHDLGLMNGRKYHHIDSRKILEADEFIAGHFGAEEIRLMGEAVEDHRASNSERPRNSYGLIVAEADRFIDAETIVRRTIQYGLSNYPELDREGQKRRCMEHLREKYGPEGYLKIWIEGSDNAVRLKALHRMMAEGDGISALFDRLYDEETAR